MFLRGFGSKVKGSVLCSPSGGSHDRFDLLGEELGRLERLHEWKSLRLKKLG